MPIVVKTISFRMVDAEMNEELSSKLHSEYTYIVFGGMTLETN